MVWEWHGVALARDVPATQVVAHEIAHSWTGNLVTNANWSHFWSVINSVLIIGILFAKVD